MDRATLQQLSCAVAARSVDVHLKAVEGDVADGGASCQPLSMTQSFGLLLLQ
jgi:hypothetical protein